MKTKKKKNTILNKLIKITRLHIINKGSYLDDINYKIE